MSENRRIKDVVEYLQEVSKIKAEWPNSTLVFRGQENEEWLLDSSAERRLKASLPSQEEITDPLFLKYNEDLTKKCRLKNYDKREQKQLYDLELLADLQHHGAATCLIDFTRNALVALWFACQKSDDADGKVFVVNIANQRTFGEITHKDIEDYSISDILQFKPRDTDQDQATELPTPETLATSPNKPNFWHWTPAHLNERITAQHSLFLFGLPSSEKLRSKEIIIESASKEQIQKELESLHNICEESLFPDFVGFAYIQRADAPYLTPDAEKYFHSGIKALQRGHSSEAIQDLTKAIELNPNDADAYAVRGASYISQDEHDQAIQDLTKAIELKPDYADAYDIRGHAYLRQEEHDRVIQDLTKAIELNPKLAGAYYFRSLAYYSKSEYDCAIRDLTKAIELNPNDADTYYTRSRAYVVQEEHDWAIKDSTKAIELNPKLAGAYNIRGLAYYSKSEYDYAIQDLTKAIELKPDYAEAYYTRGRSYGSQGKYDHTIEDVTKAIELKPELFDAYRIRGHVYVGQGKYDHAIQDLTKAVALKPNYAEAYYARALAYVGQGKYDHAIQDLTKAVELEPKLSGAYYTRALAWLYLQKWQEARSDLTTAKDMGFDIVASFRRYAKSIADFEQKIGIKLPEDIAAMLTESEN